MNLRSFLLENSCKDYLRIVAPNLVKSAQHSYFFITYLGKHQYSDKKIVGLAFMKFPWFFKTDDMPVKSAVVTGPNFALVSGGVLGPNQQCASDQPELVEGPESLEQSFQVFRKRTRSVGRRQSWKKSKKIE